MPTKNNPAHRCAILSASLLTLAACGGGSSSSGGTPTPPLANASLGGVWRGTDSVSGLQVLGLASEAGEFYLLRSDGVRYVGTASITGNSLSATFDGFTPPGKAWPDGATHGTGSVSGTVQGRSSLTATSQFRTDAGTQSNGTLNLNFDALYNRASSLATISGNFSDPSSGTVVTVGSNGSVFSQNPANGCVLNGTVSIINASYNAYRLQLSYASCQGQAAVLNGVQFNGLATLDNTVSPERAVIGVTGQSGATKYAVALTLNRT
jgi:hypothetical protein